MLRSDTGSTGRPAIGSMPSLTRNLFATRSNLPSLITLPVRTILLAGPIIGPLSCSYFNWDRN